MRNLFIFISGLVIGGAAGVCLSASCFKKKYKEKEEALKKEQTPEKKEPLRANMPKTSGRYPWGSGNEHHKTLEKEEALEKEQTPEKKEPLRADMPKKVKFNVDEYHKTLEKDLSELRKVKGVIRDYVSAVEPEDDIPVYPVDDFVPKQEETEDPHVIDPYDYGNDECDTISYSYYSDGVIADELEEALTEDEVNRVLGGRKICTPKNDSAVYIRNPRLKLDIEIIPMQVPYTDVLMDKPYMADGKVIMNAAVQTIAAGGEDV